MDLDSGDYPFPTSNRNISIHIHILKIFYITEENDIFINFRTIFDDYNNYFCFYLQIKDDLFMNEKGHTEALEKMERKFFDEKVHIP